MMLIAGHFKEAMTGWIFVFVLAGLFMNGGPQIIAVEELSGLSPLEPTTPTLGWIPSRDEDETTSSGTMQVLSADEPATGVAALVVPTPAADHDRVHEDPPLDKISHPTTGTQRLLRALEAFHRDIKTIHVVFDQVRFDDVLMTRVRSPGELWFDKPHRLRCDYSEPEPVKNLIVDTILYIYTPELELVEYWEFESRAERDQQLHRFMIGFGLQAEQLLKLYEIHSSEDELEPRMALEKAGLDPSKKALFIVTPRPEFQSENSAFTRMEFTIDKASHLPEKIRYLELGQSETEITMKTIEQDVDLSRDLFDTKIVFPANADWINKREIP
jgi:outer membrane lipoprotein-sorting protein